MVEVLPQPGEFSTRNNRQDVYLDVIDGKEKVLLLALAPHPDIKALRSILEKNQNYELDVRILTGTAAEATAPADKQYDLIILHQIPDNGGVGNALAAEVPGQKYACFVCAGESVGNGAVQYVKSGDADSGPAQPER